MKYHVHITARAERDVDQVLQWFHDQEATATGERWFRLLLAKMDTLENHPERCRIAMEAAEFGIDLRELLFGKRRGTYRILFAILGRTVQILHIRHTARDAVGKGDLR